jgi:hypothetical protein
LWRHPIALTGGAIVVVAAAAVITSFDINHPQGSSVARVTRDARQSASRTRGEVAGEKPSVFSARQDADTSSVETSSTIADHDQAGVPGVAVPESDSHSDIQNTLDGWAKAINDNDVTLELRYYSDRLDRYFLARNVTQEFVARDKAQFYRRGNYIVAYQIGNVTVDRQSAQQATVSLIKHWKIFDGSGTKSGETRSRLWLMHRGNQWTITGEQDLSNL